MTEYDPSPGAARAFMSSRERTAYWVRIHSPTGIDFYSPSVTPSELPPTPTSPPSEVESTHSLPPKMVLKYQDGRPDIPISHWHYDAGSPPRGAPRYGETAPFREHPQGHSRSRSYNPVLDSDRGRSGRSGPHRRQRDVSPPFPHAPEEIRVWPSDSDEVPQTYPRSKSLPRDMYVRQDVPPPPMPPLHPTIHAVPMQTIYPLPPPHHAQLRPNLRNNTVPRPAPWHSLGAPRPQQILNGRPPPAMIYGPPQPFKTHYSPPALYTRPHQGPEGMRLTRSAPVQYHGAHEPPFPIVQTTATSLSSVDEERNHRRGGSRNRPRTPASGHESNDSESTYYVVPTPPQKVQVVVPDKSIYTATSTTKSVTSPSLRKPFFHRIFDMFTSSESSKGSSAGSRRIHRRHSTGGRHRSHERRGH